MCIIVISIVLVVLSLTLVVFSCTCVACVTELQYSGEIVEFNIPRDGVYRITARGAQGGNVNQSKGGRGAVVQGEFELKATETLHILCGGMGRDGGGGGGTFVSLNSRDNALLVAGGGGGAGIPCGFICGDYDIMIACGLHASLSECGKNGVRVGKGDDSGNGGKGGHGGQYDKHPDCCGAGLLTGPVGASDDGPLPFIDGGNGGGVNGGFGGGGQSYGGGGGGYSGGGCGSGVHDGGGGGGSFVAACANSPLRELANPYASHGSVSIEYSTRIMH